MPRSRGFTLPEVLFASLMLQLLLLAVLTIQTSAVQLQLNAVQRTLAVAAAADLAYSLRLDGNDSTAFSGSYSAETVLSPVSCNPATPCGASAIRQYYLYYWQQGWLSNDAEDAFQGLHLPRFCLQSAVVDVSWRVIGRDNTAAGDAGGCLPATDRSGFRFTLYQDGF